MIQLVRWISPSSPDSISSLNLRCSGMVRWLNMIPKTSPFALAAASFISRTCLGVDAGRLLAQHMDAVLEGPHRQGRMIVVGRGDEDGVDGARSEERLRVGKALDAVAKVGFGPSEPVRVGIADGRQRRAGHFASPQIVGMAAAHVANTDDPETDGLP